MSNSFNHPMYRKGYIAGQKAMVTRMQGFLSIADTDLPEHEKNPIRTLRRVAPKSKAVTVGSLSGVAEIAYGETMKAYADCHDNAMSDQEQMQERNLDFRSSVSVSRDEAIAILTKAIQHGYNEFTANLLKKLPEDFRMTIAREGSVCIYVKGGGLECLAGVLKADELDYNPATNETRIWWD